MQYRRSIVKGGSFFFTVNLAERHLTTLTDHIDIFRMAYKKALTDRPAITVAAVILPDHLHAIWQLPEGDSDYAQRWRQIKVNFSRHISKTERINQSRFSKGERGIWQRRYWEHQIRDEADLQKHVEYILYNPVKHGYVQKASEWPYSSIHRDIKNGLIPKNWGAGEDDLPASCFGGRVSGHPYQLRPTTYPKQQADPMFHLWFLGFCI